MPITIPLKSNNNSALLDRWLTVKDGEPGLVHDPKPFHFEYPYSEYGEGEEEED